MIETGAYPEIFRGGGQDFFLIHFRFLGGVQKIFSYKFQSRGGSDPLPPSNVLRNLRSHYQFITAEEINYFQKENSIMRNFYDENFLIFMKF